MPKKKRKAAKWLPDFYVRAYELARGGMGDATIAKVLGVTSATLTKWKRVRPSFRRAIERGRSVRHDKTGHTFREYVFNRLPKHLRLLWQDIVEAHESPNAIEMIEAMLKDKGRRVRQHLFLYALTSSNFNVSFALRSLNIPRRTFEEWATLDPDFGQLMREIHEYKADFYENALIGLVASGDSPATIFANKTFNRNRGYGEKTEVHHTGEVNHNVRVVEMESLDLSVAVQREILQAIRRARLPAPASITVDAVKTKEVAHVGGL